MKKGSGYLLTRWARSCYVVAMPRPPRASAANTCYHVLNRGNGRSEVFHKDGDYAAFLKLLTQANDHVRSRIESLASKHQSRPALRLTVVASRHGHTTGPGNNLASTRQTMEESNKVACPPLLPPLLPPFIARLDPLSRLSCLHVHDVRLRFTLKRGVKPSNLGD